MILFYHRTTALYTLILLSHK